MSVGIGPCLSQCGTCLYLFAHYNCPTGWLVHRPNDAWYTNLILSSDLPILLTKNTPLNVHSGMFVNLNIPGKTSSVLIKICLCSGRAKVVLIKSKGVTRETSGRSFLSLLQWARLKAIKAKWRENLSDHCQMICRVNNPPKQPKRQAGQIRRRYN